MATDSAAAPELVGSAGGTTETAPEEPVLDEGVTSAPATSNGDGKGDGLENGLRLGDVVSEQAPVWFRPEAFCDEDFSPSEYVVDMQKFVPMDTLKQELASHLSLLKAELVELINRDYNEVVNLSTELVDVQETVGRMRSPLEDLRHRLVEAGGGIRQGADALNEALARKAEVAQARGVLELLLDTGNVLSKVEKLIQELDGLQKQDGGQGGADAGAVEARSQLLERIASEVSRLTTYSARGEGLPLVESMRPRIEAAQETLRASLESCFTWGMKQKNVRVVKHCLHAYSALDDAAHGEKAIRDTLVEPLVTAALTSSGGPSGADGALPLEAAYGKIEAGVKAELAWLLEVVMAPSSGFHAFNLLGNCVLAEVLQQLSNKRPQDMSPGVPETFLQKFTASVKFLEALEACCPSVAALQAFRSSPVTHAFFKKWNLTVYFTLRFQDIAGSLDAALGPGAITAAAPGGSSSGFLCKTTTVLWDCLAKCWAENVFIIQISDRFLRLSLQLLARYQTWLQSGLKACQKKKTEDSTETEENEVSGGEWALAASPNEFLLVWHDVDMLSERVRREFLEELAVKLGGVYTSSEAVECIQSSIGEGVEHIAALAPQVMTLLREAVADKCAEVLKQLRGITAAYRMTNKPVPTRPSPYVASILQPLRGFVDGERSGYVSREQRGKLVEAVVDLVSVRYEEMAKELITAWKMTETSLQRLRKGREGGAGGGANGASDTEKISTQLFLDVQEFGRQLAKFGIKAASLESYQQLWKCVAPEDRQEIAL
mmetsp:Transcript_5380/g.19660  ORF Transcript_5380/g.19660 Transcript_5380/m.19660 type:complete len:776 (+) Transcript_5380:188-2515(+)